MEKSVTLILKQTIAAIWRNRFLLFVPLLILLPLSIISAKVLPKKYIATALLAMPESDRDNPFVKRRGGVDYSLIKRIEGLEAWLKSDHVLSAILQQFSKTNPEREPLLFALKLQDLRDAISLRLVGNDFLRFTYISSKPKGMGKKLGAITTRFLEGLLIPDKTVTSAGQFVMQFHHKKVLETRMDRQAFEKEHHKELSRAGSSAVDLEMDALRNKLREGRAEHKQLEKQILALRRSNISPAAPGALKGSGKSTIMDQINNKNSAGSIQLSPALKAQLLDLKRKKDRLVNRLAEISNRIKSSRDSRVKRNRIQARLFNLKEAERKAVENSTQSSKLLTNVYVQNPLGIINAPEGIKMIDPPKDPIRPATSSLKIVIAGLIGSIFLGAGLAAVAELTDTRIHTPEEIAMTGGARIVGHLPYSPQLMTQGSMDMREL